MWTAQIYNKYCANCDFWEGEREKAPTSEGKNAVVIRSGASSNEKGYCPRKKTSTTAGSSCTEWRIWNRLTD